MITITKKIINLLFKVYLMGQEFCKSCENNVNLLKIEDNLSNVNQNFSVIFKPTIENENITKNNFDNFSKFKIITNNDFFPSNIYSESSISNNINIYMSEKIQIEKIKLNYKIKLITKYFKKYKNLINESHKIIIKEKSSINNIPITETNSINSDIQNDEININLNPEEEYIFIGSKFNNKYDGFGIQKFLNSNSIFIGLFKEGKKQNNKICKFKNQNLDYSYYGYIKNNKSNDFGILINYKNENENNIKIYYYGEFKDNKKNGIGIEKYDDESYYKGEFINGKKNGIGKYFWKDNSEYFGEWKNNELNGYGIYKFNNGSYYYGEWKNNKMNGFGLFNFNNLQFYYGLFENDKKKGFGIVYWINIKKFFIGFWDDNKQNGFGKYYNNDNVIFGKWINGINVKKYDNYNIFICNFNNEEKNFLDFFNFDYEEIGKFVKNFIN